MWIHELLNFWCFDVIWSRAREGSSNAAKKRVKKM
jgi:hypothetical protein